MADRYWVPMSAPCRFNVVGSWMVKKTFSRSRYEMTPGSKATCTTSACPVSPVHTCLYVGSGTCPPEYPETTSVTPSRSSKTASRHQKHPAASVATSVGMSPSFGLSTPHSSRACKHPTKRARSLRKSQPLPAHPQDLGGVVAAVPGVVPERFKERDDRAPLRVEVGPGVLLRGHRPEQARPACGQSFQ